MSFFDPTTWFSDLKAWFGFQGRSDVLTWWGVFWLSLIPFGQLYARVNYYNGSLDKFFLIFFQLPPFSFIPMILIKYGYIKDGKGAAVSDAFMYIPILLSFLLPPIIGKIFEKLEFDEFEFIQSALVTLLIIGSIFAINIYRRSISCKEGITTDSIGKAGIDAVIEYGFSTGIPILLTFIPGIGDVLDMAMGMPIIGPFISNIIWAICFIGLYTLFNMFNQDDIDRYCSTPFYGNFLDQVMFFIALFIMAGSAAINSI